MQVKVGGKICEITKIEAATVICNPPDLTAEEQKQNTNVTVNDNENLFYDIFPKVGRLGKNRKRRDEIFV